MHFCTANIMIGSDQNNVMTRDETSPVSWPEVEVLRVIHGDHSVTDVKPFVEVKQKPRDERQRLAFIYGNDALAQVWGGRNAPSEMDAPKASITAGVTWFNPLTNLLEETTKTGSKQIDPKAVAKPPQVAPEMEAETVGDPRPGIPEDETPFDEDEDEDEKAPAKKSTTKKK